MRPIGFSTGALARANFRLGLEMIGAAGIKVVELSALREAEVRPLLEALDEIRAMDFEYVSVHAPSSYQKGNEEALIEALRRGVPEEWNVILHPDAVDRLERWAALGKRLLIENMDKRKTTGRFVRELEEVFEVLPAARFCFDVAHARQVDTTMWEASRLLEAFGDRLAQVHISELSSSSRHHRLSIPAVWRIQRVAGLIPEDVPIIIEAPVGADEMANEVSRCREALQTEAPGIAATA